MIINTTAVTNLYKLIAKKLSQVEISGGVAISDSAIRYVRFHDNNKVCVKASLRLPAGAVIGGKIANKDIVEGALAALRQMISVSSAQKAEVIISLASEAVYSQLFNLPQLTGPSLTEAANLNIQMISPLDTKISYSSYQLVGELASSGAGEYQFLGSFIHSSIIDAWLDVFRATKFSPVAVEFKSLSVVRAASEFTNIAANETALIIDISSEGMDIMIMKNKNLYFDYSYSWKLIQGGNKAISMDKFKQVLITETGKVMNFAISKFGSEVKSILINAEGEVDTMMRALKDAYPVISVIAITVPTKCGSSLWLTALGAAKRGLLSRSEDALISLTPKNVVAEHKENQIFAVISLWRKISITILVFLLFAFGTSNLFIRNIQLGLAEKPAVVASPEDTQEFQYLQNKASALNSLISLVGAAILKENEIYPFVDKIFNLAGNIQITRLSFVSIDQPIMLSGNAVSPSAAMQFQGRLAELPNITNVELPLANLITAPNGRTHFTMSFRITSLDF